MLIFPIRPPTQSPNSLAQVRIHNRGITDLTFVPDALAEARLIKVPYELEFRNANEVLLVDSLLLCKNPS